MIKRILVVIFLCCVVFSGCSAGPQVEWESFSQEKMAEAAQTRRPIVIYFYAAWCGVCYHLKEQTFSDPAVIETLEPFVRLKADLSFSNSEKVERIATDYGIGGVPTVILFDQTGREAARLSGMVSSDRLIAAARTVLRAAPAEATDPFVDPNFLL